jgi:hypothetical protein
MHRGGELGGAVSRNLRESDLPRVIVLFFRVMRSLLLATLVLLCIGMTSCGSSSSAAAKVRSCGSFKDGLAGQEPGRSGVTALNTSCWMALAIAIMSDERSATRVRR